MGYTFLDHATDAIVEVTAKDMNEAFMFAGMATVEIMIEPESVDINSTESIRVVGTDDQELLYNWLEEIIFDVITKGFAISKITDVIYQKKEIIATIHGESLDIEKHNFKVEIKAPTFHEMSITNNEFTYMKFLLDL